MKTKILLLFVLIFSLAGSCEPDAIETSCDCEKVNYTYKVRLDGVQANWYYQKDYSEPIPCTVETGKYVQTDSNKFYRIECK